MAPFPVTKWTLILVAGRRASADADDALSELCAAYWYPAYAFVRRMGYSPDDSLDLTQEFFSRFLEKRPFAEADPKKGRFRSFLLTCIKRFLADQTDQRNAAKRGGRSQMIPLEIDGAEHRYSSHLADQQTPERLFEREWALTLIARVNEQVRAAFVREGRVEYFDRLKPFLPGNESGSPLSQIAGELGMTESALKVAIHRLRRRYREVFRTEISELVSEPSEIDDEVQHLLQILRT
jgi:RNA polymerase sigma-70 factor (ECF subfamily)